MSIDKVIDSLGRIDDDLIQSVEALRLNKKKRPQWLKWGAIAACLCLIVAAAAAIPKLLPENSSKPDPIPGTTLDQTQEPDVYPQVENTPASALDESQDPCVFCYNEASSILDAARKYIPGYFTQELNDGELAAIIPDKQTSEMTFSGYAGFDGEGSLIDVVLQADAPFIGDANVALIFSKNEPLRCYVIPGEPVISTLNGHNFEVYKWSDNGETHCYDAIGYINGYYVQISYMSNGSNAGHSITGFEIVTDCFTSYKDGKPDLSLIKADAIPDFFDLSLTLSQACSDTDFGAYMLQAVPSGYAEESIRRYKDQNNNYLSGLWTKGYDNLSWVVKPYNEGDAHRLTSVDNKKNYDLSLYPIPRADSVPDELREIVDNPIFEAEELTLDAIYCRAYKTNDAGDTNGWRMKFSVKYGNVIVSVSTKGVEPEWLYQQLVNLISE